MNGFLSFMPKNTRALILVLTVIIIILVLILLIARPKTTTLPYLPVVSQSPTLSPLQKTIIGKTKIDDIEKNYQIKNKQVMPNGDLKYSLDSRIETRPHQITFHNSLAQFERVVIVDNATISGQLKLSDQILKYGPAEKVIKGSKFYGNHMDTYIYATKGFTFIANTNANEVYEIQIFTPTSLENYLDNYGEDITQFKEIKE